MADSRDIAPEALGECGERGGLGLERKPGEERAPRRAAARGQRRAARSRSDGSGTHNILFSPRENIMQVAKPDPIPHIDGTD